MSMGIRRGRLQFSAGLNVSDTSTLQPAILLPRKSRLLRRSLQGSCLPFQYFASDACLERLHLLELYATLRSLVPIHACGGEWKWLYFENLTRSITPSLGRKRINVFQTKRLTISDPLDLLRMTIVNIEQTLSVGCPRPTQPSPQTCCFIRHINMKRKLQLLRSLPGFLGCLR